MEKKIEFLFGRLDVHVNKFDDLSADVLSNNSEKNMTNKIRAGRISHYG